jgi:tRNA (adenine37-N6)-methyltransferase
MSGTEYDNPFGYILSNWSRGKRVLRGDQSRPKQGVFSLNSSKRPNPIGVTVVDLIGIEGNILCVRSLDAIDGTPVLDLKQA